jgi:energy-coupling factor transport system permease protein
MNNSFIAKLSIQKLKQEILNATYGNRDIFLATVDPRIILVWYAIFAITPWFFYDRTILVGFLIIVICTALWARINRLLLFLLVFGVLSDIIGWTITSLLFCGNLTTFWALSPLLLKLVIVSMASLTAFSALDPDRLADALLLLKTPDQIAFAVSYAYRMLPILVSEYVNLIHTLRNRTKPPSKGYFYRLRTLQYYLRLIVRAFYPMILNTAIRTRLVVECLELRGFTYAMQNSVSRDLRVKYLRIRAIDISFISITILLWFIVVQIGMSLTEGK